jgi:hypothetical protein
MSSLSALSTRETLSDFLAYILNFRDYAHHATSDAGFASQHEIVAMHENRLWLLYVYSSPTLNAGYTSVV